jgi:hypothetical protein
MTALRLAVLLTLAYTTILGSTFIYNLPNWCANQHIESNRVIHPLCK